MFEFILFTSLVLFTFSLLTNISRSRKNRDRNIELTPNCLLTRWPIVFVTGSRSIFYFLSYWNDYPAFLAEHGYEVFTLHLPWRDKKMRQERFHQFLTLNPYKKFHLFMDTQTALEFQSFIEGQQCHCIESITEITGHQDNPELKMKTMLPYFYLRCMDTRVSSFGQKIAFQLHKSLISKSHNFSLSTLGWHETENCENHHALLSQAQKLAESDLISG